MDCLRPVGAAPMNLNSKSGMTICARVEFECINPLVGGAAMAIAYEDYVYRYTYTYTIAKAVVV